MKAWHWILIVVGLAVIGFLVYWFGFRKRVSLVPPVGAQPPVKNQTTSQKIIGFAENEGKKILSDAISRFL